MIGNPAFTVDFPIETLGFHGQATLLEDVPVVHVVPETRPLAFRLSSPSDPAQRHKGAFCRQLCQRTPRQLLSLELELLEIGENVRCPVPLGFRAKPT